MMKTNEYILLNGNKNLNGTDLENLIEKLNKVNNLGVVKENNEITFFNKEKKETAKITLSEKTIFSTDPLDLNLLILIRQIAEELKFRLYMEDLEAFLPRHKFMDRITDIPLPASIMELLSKLEFKPIFAIAGTFITYVQGNDKSIYLMNEHLLKHFVNFGHSEVTKDLYYKVAVNLQEFVAKMDQGLIPTEFFKYYDTNCKIINLSGMDINSPKRKIFVKPLIFEFENENDGFLMVLTEKGSAIYCDKILQNENLDLTVKRILRENLKIAEDYIGAIVLQDMEYDRDKFGELIPRLIVKLFLPKGNLKDKLKDKQWLSQDEVKF